MCPSAGQCYESQHVDTDVLVWCEVLEGGVNDRTQVGTAGVAGEGVRLRCAGRWERYVGSFQWNRASCSVGGPGISSRPVMDADIDSRYRTARAVPLWYQWKFGLNAGGGTALVYGLGVR